METPQRGEDQEIPDLTEDELMLIWEQESWDQDDADSEASAPVQTKLDVLA